MDERRPFLERFKTGLFTVARVADVFTREASPRVRPILRTAFLGLVCLWLVAMLPFMPLIWWRQDAWMKKHKQKLAPVSELESHVRRIWVETSPEAAVDAVRDVFERCRANRSGAQIEPFGKFEWGRCADALADLLYRYEASRGHWDKALAVAELRAAERGQVEAMIPTWILSQAKCLVRLGRSGEALTLLMAHRDVYNPDAPVNQYLEEVRAGRG